MIATFYDLAVLLGGFTLLTVLVVRGMGIYLAAPLCALLILILSGADPLSGMTGPYMSGFADYLRRFYLIFALGAAFAKLMEDSGAATRIAVGIGRMLGTKRACLAVVLACAVLTYGGVSLFVVGFAVYPLAVQLFRAADLPRRFIPGAILFGSVTFTMTSAGSPEIQNLIPIQYLTDSATGQPLTDARAGWPASLIVAVLMFLSGQLYLEQVIRRDVLQGGRFEARPDDPPPPAEKPDSPDQVLGPGWFASLAPLAITLVALNALPPVCHWLGSLGLDGEENRWQALLRQFPEDPTLSIFLGTASGLWFLRRHLISGWVAVSDGFVKGMVAIGYTASVVGFGNAVKDLPAFKQIVDWVTHIPGDPLIGAALAVAVIAGITGSASGGQGLALPIIKPIYIDQLGVPARALHRVVAIASGSLDSLPANGYVTMLIRNVCGETHARAYGPVFVTTVVIPFFGTILAIVLFKLFPSWAFM